MARHQPVAEPMVQSTASSEPTPAGDMGPTPMPWTRPCTELDRASRYWLATTTPDGRPHVVPLLAVMLEDRLCFCTSERSKKAKNLAVNPACVLTTAGSALDLVIEGEATAVRDETEVQHVAEAYATKYGWHTEVQQGGLWAHGAPTAGPSPYRVHQIKPITAFSFPTDVTAVPTRWCF